MQQAASVIVLPHAGGSISHHASECRRQQVRKRQQAASVIMLPHAGGS